MIKKTLTFSIIAAAILFATPGLSFASAVVHGDKIYLDDGAPQGIFKFSGTTNAVCFFTASDGELGCLEGAYSGASFLGDTFLVGDFGTLIEWPNGVGPKDVIGVALNNPADTTDCFDGSGNGTQAACEALPEYSNTLTIHVVQSNPAAPYRPVVQSGVASIQSAFSGFLPIIFVPAILLGVFFAVYYGIKRMKGTGSAAASGSRGYGKSAAVNKKRYATIPNSGSRTFKQQIEGPFKNAKDRNAFMKSYRRHISKQGRNTLREMKDIRRRINKYA